jgi:succinate dehydrogenase / fumarate reductase membrane anchor subunit
MRSSLGQVRGLGSAKSGTAHWWAQRVTAVALLPLTLWFVLMVLRLATKPATDVAHWATSPVNATLLLALVIITFYHMALGLQVVIEDYMHKELPRMATLLAVKGVCALFTIAGVVAVLKLAVIG